MQRFEEPVQNLRGDVLTLCPMLVMVAGTTTPATIFADAAGQAVIASPSTDRTGVLAFYAPNGRYDIYALINGQRMGHKLDYLLDDPVDGAVDQTAAIAAVQADANALQLADYTALRAYTRPRKSVYVIASGIAGMFVRDDSDTTTADNGGTVIVATNGKRWKRAYSSPVSVQWFGAISDGVTDDTAAVQAAINTGKPVDFGGKANTYRLTSTVTYTGTVTLLARGATIKADGQPFRFTDASNSRVHGLRFMPLTTPYTITRNPVTWAASAVTQSLEGYMPTSQDADIWSTLPSYVQAQFDNFQPGGIKFDVSSTAGGRDVQVSGITGYQACITLEGYSDSTVMDCDFGGKREAIYFYNALAASTGAFTLPRGVNNSVRGVRIRYASQCGVVFFGNDRFKVEHVWSHDNGESGVKTYQHDQSMPAAVMCTDGVLANVHTFNNYYDGMDVTNVNGIDSPGSYESRHTLSACYSFFNRHTGITICGQKNNVFGCNAQNNGSHGINGQGVNSKFIGNYAAYNAAHPEIHPFQIFDICIQGDGNTGRSNDVLNPNAPSTYNYIHTGLFGADPTTGAEGQDEGNYCSGGPGRKLVSANIPSSDGLFVGSGSRANTAGAVAVFRQPGGGGADVYGTATDGFVRVRASGSAQVDFTPLGTDPNSTPGYSGRILYGFGSDTMRFLIAGGVQSAYLQKDVGFFPSPDNTLTLGYADAGTNFRWKNIYAVNLTLTPPSSVTPTKNGQMTFELTSDTQLKVKVMGSDGTVRSASLTLA